MQSLYDRTFIHLLHLFNSLTLPCAFTVSHEGKDCLSTAATMDEILRLQRELAAVQVSCNTIFLTITSLHQLHDTQACRRRSTPGPAAAVAVATLL